MDVIESFIVDMSVVFVLQRNIYGLEFWEDVRF